MILEKKYFSIVFLGNHNPSILNHDFLVRNNILPLDVLPFSALEFKNASNPPFNESIATPVISRLVYSNISIVVEETRFQLTDNSSSGAPEKSPIIAIAKNYFSLLKHTPLVFCGINFNCLVNLKTDEERNSLESKLCIKGLGLSEVVGSDALDFGINFSYKYKYGLATITMSRIKNNSLGKRLNFNFEFPFKDMGTSLTHLDDIADLYQHFEKFVSWITAEAKNG